MIVTALLLQIAPIIGNCSTRANSCSSVHGLIRRDAASCGVTVDFRPYDTDGAVIFDVARFEVTIRERATDVQHDCLAEAVRTAHSRLIGSKK